LHGPQQGIFDFRFDLPALCAAAIEDGKADIGLVPCAELDRLGLDFLPDLGIACEGPVRSILLVSQVPFGDIRTLAVDSGSRTSVALARIILAERYGCEPLMTRRMPDLGDMLAESDAALLIGDPALRLKPEMLPWRTLDLGAEWVAWSGLPMVFAVWAGHSRVLTGDVASAFRESFEWGREHTEELVERASLERGFDPELTRRYLTEHIVYRLRANHLEGLALFRSLVRKLEPLPAVSGVV
jgi:predicted solute-binding protein